VEVTKRKEKVRSIRGHHEQHHHHHLHICLLLLLLFLHEKRMTDSISSSYIGTTYLGAVPYLYQLALYESPSSVVVVVW